MLMDVTVVRMLFRSSLALIVLIALPLPSHAANCSVAQPHPLTSPQIAMMGGQFAEAESLYRADLAKNPNNEESTAGLVRALLAQQKVDDAAATVEAALTKDPQSPVLLTALAVVQHREGLPWEEAKTLDAALTTGICYAPLYLARANYFRFNSFYATSLRQIQMAHQLDPYDPQIWREWMHVLPPAQRIEELKKFLATNSGDINEVRGAKVELAMLENESGNGARCQLLSQTTATDIPFTPIMVNAEFVRAWGLEVAFNGKKSHLVIDTGASGLYINSALANKAGLKPLTRTQVGGIGDNGAQSGYLALADSIRIGGLEFRNCMVQVSDRRNVVGNDGLIGMDVFSQFAVTLDFPWRKLTLGPLPPYPGMVVAPMELNTAAHGQGSSTNSGPHDRYVAPEMSDWMEGKIFTMRPRSDLLSMSSKLGENCNARVRSLTTSMSADSIRSAIRSGSVRMKSRRRLDRFSLNWSRSIAVSMARNTSGPRISANASERSLASQRSSSLVAVCWLITRASASLSCCSLPS